jgi:hypothetical protein
MRLPIDQTKLTVLVIGEPRPVLTYGTDVPKTSVDGRPLYKLPVLLSGTGDRIDPVTTVTIPGPLPEIQKGQTVRFQNLTISTWTVRTSKGDEIFGTTLRAEGIETQSKQSR